MSTPTLKRSAIVSPEEIKNDEKLMNEFILYKERVKRETETRKNYLHCDITTTNGGGGVILSLFTSPITNNTSSVLLCNRMLQDTQTTKVKDVDDRLVDKQESVWKEDHSTMLMIDNLPLCLVLSIDSDTINSDTLASFLVSKYGMKFYSYANTNSNITDYQGLAESGGGDGMVVDLMTTLDQQNMNDYKIYNRNSQYPSAYMKKEDTERLQEMLNIRFIRGIKQFTATGEPRLKKESQFKVYLDNHIILMFLLRSLRNAGHSHNINETAYKFRVLDPVKISTIYDGPDDHYIEKQLNHKLNPNFHERLSFPSYIQQTEGLLSPGCSPFPGYIMSMSNTKSDIKLMIQESSSSNIYSKKNDKFAPVFGYNKYFMNISCWNSQITLYRVDYNSRITRLSDSNSSSNVVSSPKTVISESSVAFIRAEKEKNRKKRGQSLITTFFNNSSSSSSGKDKKNDDDDADKNDDDENISHSKKKIKYTS
jgi:hypothetical protein